MSATKIVKEGEVYVLEYTERNGKGTLVIFKNGEMEFVCSEHDLIWLHDNDYSSMPILVEVAYLNEEKVQLLATSLTGPTKVHVNLTYEQFVATQKSEFMK